MKQFFLDVLFIIGFFHYMFLIMPVHKLLELLCKGLGIKDPDLFSISLLTLALVISSWFLLWGRLPFPFFGFHR